MCQKVHKKWVPAWDQGAFLTMFEKKYMKKSPNEDLPIFLYLKYYEDFLEKNHPIPDCTFNPL